MDAHSINSAGRNMCMAIVASEVILHQAKVDVKGCDDGYDFYEGTQKRHWYRKSMYQSGIECEAGLC